MKRRGHAVLGAVAGLFFGISLTLVLLVAGTVPLDSIVVLVVPGVLLVAGAVWGKVAPLGRPPAG